MRKVLSCVARLNGGFGRKRIALCLAGSDAREVVDAGLHRVTTFGALRGRPVAWVLDVLGTLEAAGLVDGRGRRVSVPAHHGGGARGHARSRAHAGGAAGRARGVVARQARARRRRGGGGGGGARRRRGDDEPIDEPLFARLRELRARLAKAEQLPAYCVFHDRTLAALARQRPATLDEMAAVPGVGPAKLAKYGAAFLDALRAPDELSGAQSAAA